MEITKMSVENTLTDSWVYLKYCLAVAFHPSVFKAIASVVLILYSFLFDIAHSQALLALFALVLMDFVSGVYASKVAGEPIRSSKIKHTAIKLTAYFGVVAGSHLAESGLITYLAVLDETVIAFFLCTELISLLENVGRLGFQTPKKLLNQLVDVKSKL